MWWDQCEHTFSNRESIEYTHLFSGKLGAKWELFYLRNLTFYGADSDPRNPTSVEPELNARTHMSGETSAAVGGKSRRDPVGSTASRAGEGKGVPACAGALPLFCPNAAFPRSCATSSDAVQNERDLFKQS